MKLVAAIRAMSAPSTVFIAQRPVLIVVPTCLTGVHPIVLITSIVEVLAIDVIVVVYVFFARVGGS